MACTLSGGLPTRPTRPGLGAPKARGPPRLGGPLRTRRVCQWGGAVVSRLQSRSEIRFQSGENQGSLIEPWPMQIFRSLEYTRRLDAMAGIWRQRSLVLAPLNHIRCLSYLLALSNT